MKKLTLIPVMLSMILLISIFLSMRFGAINLTWEEIQEGFTQLFSGGEVGLNARIFAELRLPRVLLCVITGASLAVGGVLMQALFRNPIVEPGLVGTSSGAAFGASLYFVLGSVLSFNAGEWTLPIAACLGGIIATYLVFVLSGSFRSRASIVGLLLTGIAINALFLSGIGFLSYIARDPQARSITFWNLGTISGANWHSVFIVGVSTIACALLGLRYTKSLNALMMGEDEAQLIGVNIKRLKLEVLTINVIIVSVATAFTGVISFVGLIVPHILRMMGGSDNRYLLLNGVLLGGIVVTLADLIARMSLRPAELPIGIVTSVVGVPVFIFLLRKGKFYF
ncbi:ABC-type Fe3+-siderophore transport system, permease component [Owenweeksia hongkongensis DSM 17368]|uniref:ABC-type Fe3+-siderophore transport system, permease component n=1 Tax=Owenweeksia hongkongensis (strain DSM 17368 / CIP 108786 / JCM 12287 / NRRL B-23963 / UST20020801) TaxID=926562 RepID=G8R0I5_OWEHD|nr:iron ABC transporter permease [Owenweeksia hongkongensis]AEV32689.1 ABC-type Fe3+-siderophore transport system, permease component [Owenweeksia hongkongensis DSM 17368]